MQVGSRESSAGDARADVTCELINGSRNLLRSSASRLTIILHETSARASTELDSREPTCIMYTRRILLPVSHYDSGYVISISLGQFNSFSSTYLPQNLQPYDTVALLEDWLHIFLLVVQYCPQITSWPQRGVNVLGAVRG
jgi:hypothetical protein